MHSLLIRTGAAFMLLMLPGLDPCPLWAAERKAHQDAAPTLQKKAPGVLRLGQIQINKDTKNLLFPARIGASHNQLDDPLIAAGTNSTKALLETNVPPYHIYLALSLIRISSTSGPQGGSRTQKVKLRCLLPTDKGYREQVPLSWLAPWIGEGYRTGNGRWIAPAHRMVRQTGALIGLRRDSEALAVLDESLHRKWSLALGHAFGKGKSVIVSISLLHDE